MDGVSVLHGPLLLSVHLLAGFPSPFDHPSTSISPPFPPARFSQACCCTLIVLIVLSNELHASCIFPSESLRLWFFLLSGPMSTPIIYLFELSPFAVFYCRFYLPPALLSGSLSSPSPHGEYSCTYSGFFHANRVSPCRFFRRF